MAKEQFTQSYEITQDGQNKSLRQYSESIEAGRPERGVREGSASAAMKARRTSARVVETAVNTAVAWSTAARVAVTRLDAAATSVKTRRRATRVEELARVAEVLVRTDAQKLI